MQKELGIAFFCIGMQSFRFFSLLLLLLLGVTVLGVWGQVGRLDLQIDEEQSVGILIGDISVGFSVGTVVFFMYFIFVQEGSGVGIDLVIDEYSGVVRIVRVLDREQRDRYRFIVVIFDGVIVEVIVRVVDINDYVLVFFQVRVVLQIFEYIVFGICYLLEFVRDVDVGRLGIQGYVLFGDGVGEIFQLEIRFGLDGVLVLELVVIGELDRENRLYYML